VPSSSTYLIIQTSTNPTASGVPTGLARSSPPSARFSTH